MADSDHELQLEALLAHQEWVRELALRLARDPHDAADLEQDLWLAVVRKSPQVRSIRAWFATVLRNAARKRHRGAERRGRRERVAAVPEAAVPSAADTVERADAHRRLVRIVLTLEEPYRSTLLLRFFEGLPLREVARRTAAPVETARSRLRRGLALLRTTLKEQSSARAEDWLAVLVPLLPVRVGDASAPTTGGIVLMATSTRIVGAGVLLVGAVGTWLAISDPEPTQPRASEADVARVEAPRPHKRLDRTPRSQTPALHDTQDPAAPVPAPPTGTRSLRGRVTDATGAPLRGVAVSVPSQYGHAWTETGDDGSFTLRDVQPGDVPIWAVAWGWRSENGALVQVTSDGVEEQVALRMVPDRIIRLTGTVRPAADQVLVGARVTVNYVCTNEERLAAQSAPDPVFAAMYASHPEDTFPPAMRRFRDLSASVDASGRFEMEVPQVAGTLWLKVRAKDHFPGRLGPVHLQDETPQRRLDIQLRASFGATGLVVDDETDLPIGGSAIAFQRTQVDFETATETDRSGRFHVTADDWGEENVRIAHEGYIPVKVALPSDGSELRVGLNRAHVIAGRVLRDDGVPVPGAVVRPESPSRSVDHVGRMMATTTDSDGRFELQGVWNATWTLAVEPQTDGPTAFVLTRVEGVSAGDRRVEVRVALGAVISGRVVDESGNALPNVPVSAERTDEAALPGGSSDAVTDASGRFRLRGLRHGTFDVAATGTAVGHLDAHVRQVIAGTESLHLVLGSGLSISGRVVDESGRAVAGRIVIACRGGLPMIAAQQTGPFATTDADGRFTVSGLVEGTYGLMLKGSTADWERVWLSGDHTVQAGREGLALRASSGSTLRGTVVDATGKPVPKHTVMVGRRDEKGDRRMAVTDDRGRFELSGLPPEERFILTPYKNVDVEVVAGAADVWLELP